MLHEGFLRVEKPRESPTTSLGDGATPEKLLSLREGGRSDDDPSNDSSRAGFGHSA
jgi:hypothetical protein